MGLGFRGLGFKGLGFRGSGFRGLGFRVLGVLLSLLAVSSFRALGSRLLLFRLLPVPRWFGVWSVELRGVLGLELRCTCPEPKNPRGKQHVCFQGSVVQFGGGVHDSALLLVVGMPS